MNLATFMIALSLAGQPNQAPHHPAFAPDRQALEAAWDRGFNARPSDVHRTRQRFKKSLRGDSTLLVRSPLLEVFDGGAGATERQLSAEDREKARREAVDRELSSPPRIRLTGELVIEPRTSGPRFLLPTADDLKGVTAELRVGSRVYTPLHQPGDVAPHVAYSSFEYDTRTGDDLRPTGDDTSGVNPRPGVGTYLYEYYRGSFELQFDLLDASGTPRVTAEDREIKVVVRGRFGQQVATYRLADLTKVP